jgi:ketosteroid isomerase-like protein
MTEKEIEQHIIELEKKGLDEWSNGNPEGYTQHLAPEATYFDDIAAQNGLKGSTSIGNYLASLNGKVPVHTYKLKDPQVVIYGNTAILTLIYSAKNPDGTVRIPWKATVIYNNTDRGWKIVHSNWSLIKNHSNSEI